MHNTTYLLRQISGCHCSQLFAKCDFENPKRCSYFEFGGVQKYMRRVDIDKFLALT